MRWPNVARVGVAYLRAETGMRTVTKLPAELEANLPLYRVTRGPGSDNKITESVLLDVETFVRNDNTAAAEDALWSAAEDARQAIHALGGQVVDGSLVDTANTATAPTIVDYGNDKVLRAVASYRLEFRKR